MLAVLLAASTAIVWGGGDYCGGRAARGGNAIGVTVASQLFSLPIVALCVVLLPGTFRFADLAWGAASGAFGFLGLVLLYRGLATGAMAVVAPITGVTSAVIPMAVGLVTDRMPSILALAGAGCALVAIALVSAGSAGGNELVTPRIIRLALGSGVLFGFGLSLLAQ